jgi:hypothetical protein
MGKIATVTEWLGCEGNLGPALKANEDGSGDHQGLGALGELLDDCSPIAGRLLWLFWEEDVNHKSVLSKQVLFFQGHRGWVRLGVSRSDGRVGSWFRGLKSKAKSGSQRRKGRKGKP